MYVHILCLQELSTALRMGYDNALYAIMLSVLQCLGSSDYMDMCALAP